jgi:cytochrome c553
MPRLCILAAACLLWVSPAAPLQAADKPAAKPATKPTASQLAFFEKKIRPLLVARCYGCHSAKAKSVKGGLLLDSRNGWVSGGESGTAVVPGKPGESLLIEAVRYEGLEMPPKEKLTANQVADLVRWVEMGAPDPRRGGTASLIRREINIEEGRSFWAFQPPNAALLPDIENRKWPASPIDHFILARIEAAGIAPVQDADKTTLARRLYFDLIGLPPTPRQLEAFLADVSPQAVEALVDTLLASPHFGQRWARHWLDIARFAESTGMERNYTFPHAWRYRDYVIDAFNKDLPFDRFVREQVAGDLIEAKSPEERNRLKIATGFLAMGPKSLNQRNKAIFRMDIVDEQIDITTRAIMGLTVSCARCHDHKFDPFPTEDYYALAGIFRSTETLYGTTKGQGNRQPGQLASLEPVGAAARPPRQATATESPKAPAAANPKRIKQLTAQLNTTRKELKAARAKLTQAQLKNKKKVNQALRPFRVRIKRLNKQLQQARKSGGKRKGRGPAKPTGPVAMGVREGSPADCRVHIRGNVRTLGDSVARGYLQVVQIDGAQPINSTKSGRLELAAWLTHRDNPLTARVMANRVWYHLTGRGLVTTLDNFGAMGQRPSHPELLDHLAIGFQENGWSVKSLVRSIVLSRTYQLSSHPTTAGTAADPDNSLLWRMNHRRLDAEAIRDAMLAASGQLDPKPRQKSAVAAIGDVNIGRNANVNRRLDEFSRNRSVYLPIVRNRLPEMLRLFDFAEPSIIVGRRDVTTVPTQALFLLNSNFVLTLSDQMAKKLLASENDESARVRHAYRLALSRTPSEAEIAAARGLVDDTIASLPDGDDAARELQAWSLLCQSLLACAEFRYLE